MDSKRRGNPDQLGFLPEAQTPPETLEVGLEHAHHEESEPKQPEAKEKEKIDYARALEILHQDPSIGSGFEEVEVKISGQDKVTVYCEFNPDTGSFATIIYEGQRSGEDRVIKYQAELIINSRGQRNWGPVERVPGEKYERGQIKQAMVVAGVRQIHKALGRRSRDLTKAANYELEYPAPDEPNFEPEPSDIAEVSTAPAGSTAGTITTETPATQTDRPRFEIRPTIKSPEIKIKRTTEFDVVEVNGRKFQIKELTSGAYLVSYLPQNTLYDLVAVFEAVPGEKPRQIKLPRGEEMAEWTQAIGPQLTIIERALEVYLGEKEHRKQEAVGT